MGVAIGIPGAARKIQARLLVVAWVLALASVPAPAIDPPSILWIFHIPVAIWIYACFVSPFVAPLQPESMFMAAAAVGVFLFLLTPWLVFGSTWRRHTHRARLASLGLLGPWVFPVVLRFFASPQQKHHWGYQHAAWGYYLLAVAHTVAFIAIQIGPQSATRTDRRRGFPVVPLSDETSKKAT